MQAAPRHAAYLRLAGQDGGIEFAGGLLPLRHIHEVCQRAAAHILKHQQGCGALCTQHEAFARLATTLTEGQGKATNSPLARPGKSRQVEWHPGSSRPGKASQCLTKPAQPARGRQRTQVLQQLRVVLPSWRQVLLSILQRLCQLSLPYQLNQALLLQVEEQLVPLLQYLWVEVVHSLNGLQDRGTGTCADK
jgi:hypothetical protein